MTLDFSVIRERLDEGTAEERATFGVFCVRTPFASLSEGFDHYLGGYRPGPLVPTYHVAVWLAWNWWRIRWEPRSGAANWHLAHSINSIGEGYLWPNIDIWSDGVRSVLLAKPSARADAKPFRFTGTQAVLVPSIELEVAIDEFVSQVIELLASDRLAPTRLQEIWTDVLAERTDPETSRVRRLEALMGAEPDSVAEGVLRRLILDGGRLGEESVDELAAAGGQSPDGEQVLTAEKIEKIARNQGTPGDPRDIVKLRSKLTSFDATSIAPGRLGAVIASEVRAEAGLGTQVISDKRLAQLSGVATSILTRDEAVHSSLSFSLTGPEQTKSQVVLRPRIPTRRRFALARLLGDQLLSKHGLLHPATNSGTYRQKVQRSFAAELLSPYEMVDEMLGSDLSIEHQQDIAEHFDVSPITINRLLMNHGRIERTSDIDPDVMAA